MSTIATLHTSQYVAPTGTPLVPNKHPIPSALDRACLAAKTAAENKGQDVTVIDLRAVTPVFDFFVMSTGPSRRVVHTIVEETDAAMRSVGDRRMGLEGYDASKWVVQDYGDVLVHVFDPDTRDYYKLEELWADAKVVDWENDPEDEVEIPTETKVEADEDEE